MPKNQDNNTKSVKCSFCGKPQGMVRKIIAGPGVFICDECVTLCQDIIEEEIYDMPEEKVEQVEMPTPAEIKKVLDKFELLIRKHKELKWILLIFELLFEFVNIF